MARTARTWKCRKCGRSNPRRKEKCALASCTGRRPKPRPPKHKAVLEIPYEKWAELYGDNCMICGREPKPNKRNDRDHDHKTGKSRGILCVVCNRRLTDRITPEWLRSAADYLERAANQKGLSPAA